MVGDVPRLELAVFSVSKPLNRVKISPLVTMPTKGFTVHVNSDMIFGMNFYDVEFFKMNCLCWLISPCELILVLLM